MSLGEITWWVLANLAVLTFAIFTWTGCFYLFSFPEKKTNFQILQKLDRIGKVTAFTPLSAPASRSSSPEDLYELFYSLSEDKIEKFNRVLKRGYITNYQKIPVYRYLQGEFRILHVRELNENDFISPGILVQARAYVKPDKNSLSSAYPLVTVSYTHLTLPTIYSV